MAFKGYNGQTSRKSPCYISHTINSQFLSIPSASESKIDAYMTLSTILSIYEYYFSVSKMTFHFSVTSEADAP